VTDYYINDKIVQKSIGEIQNHLAKYGLETKKPKSLNGGQLLGIALKIDSHRNLE